MSQSEEEAWRVVSGVVVAAALTIALVIALAIAFV
jgi:hypothetical protein